MYVNSICADGCEYGLLLVDPRVVLSWLVDGDIIHDLLEICIMAWTRTILIETHNKLGVVHQI